VTLVLAAGCWRDPPPAAPEPPPPTPQTATLRRPTLTCDGAIDHAIEILHPTGSDAVRLRDTAVASCTRMEWSDEALACVSSAQTESDLDACKDHLTKEQLEDLP